MSGFCDTWTGSGDNGSPPTTSGDGDENRLNVGLAGQEMMQQHSTRHGSTCWAGG